MKWFLVALVLSSWDGHIVAQTKMAVYETEQECLVAKEKLKLRPQHTKCVKNAIQFDERLKNDK